MARRETRSSSENVPAIRHTMRTLADPFYMARGETRSSKEKVPAIRHTMCSVYPWTTPSKWRGVKHDRSRSIDPKRSRSDNFNEFLFAANSIKASINRRKTGMHEYGSSAKHQAHQTPVFSYNSLVYKTGMHEYGSSEKHQHNERRVSTDDVMINRKARCR